MATPTWAPKRKKGETEAAYKKRYYTAQRTDAEERGDQKTTDKIYGKLGRKSHSVDANASDKAILGGVALAAGGPEAAVGKMIGRAAGRGVAKAGTALARRGAGAVEQAVQDLGRARKVPGSSLATKARPGRGTQAALDSKKALPAPKPAMKAAKALPDPKKQLKKAS